MASNLEEEDAEGKAEAEEEEGEEGLEPLERGTATGAGTAGTSKGFQKRGGGGTCKER